MNNAIAGVLILAALAVPTAAAGQQPAITQTILGTRLDIDSSAEVTRVPDVAIISAGVVSHAPTASSALRESADQMDHVLAALKRAGIAERDIQTSNVNLNQEYRYPQNQAAQLVGYSATNSVTVRFHDIQNSGKILDTLVAQGANQINGPSLVVDKPDQALDEARVKAIAEGRARADLYAQSLGMHVVRLVALSEGGPSYPSPVPIMMQPALAKAATRIEAGEQKLGVSVAMTFELR